MAVLIKFQSIKVNVPGHKQRGHEEIRLTRFYTDPNCLGVPILMIHDVAQDGSSFYTSEGGGLACFLARQGFDVYVADLRGRREGWPLTSHHSAYGFHHWVTQDIPACLEAIGKKRPSTPQIWLGHGWGGVLLSAVYARYAGHYSIAKMVYVASRRVIKKPVWKQRLWQLAVNRIVWLSGYLPTKPWRLASCDESPVVIADQQRWGESEGWQDPEDGFDYADAVEKQSYPASFYFAVESDCFARPEDVRQFMLGFGEHDGRMMVLGRDYRHNTMLLDEKAEQDYFQLLLDWLKDDQRTD